MNPYHRIYALYLLIFTAYQSILVDSFVPSSSHQWKIAQFKHSTTHTKLIRNDYKNELSLYMSPSGIDEWPQVAQASVFFGTYAALAVSTTELTKLIEGVSKSIGMERWRLNAIDSTLPILLGIFYTAAGVGHFSNSQAFADIYPPMGTWGIWYLPGSAEFHVFWTGLVELLGGLGLILTAIQAILGVEQDGLVNFIKPISAAVLFVLTVCVTPANIYMFTHGAVMGDMALLDVSFHAVRFGVQVLLLSLLFTLARDGFFFAWGGELD